MPTLVPTAGDSTANTFASLAEYKGYLSEKLHAAAWVEEAIAGALDEALTVDLISSARVLSTSLTWTGSATDPSTQSLPWPRTGMYNVNGYGIGTSIIPGDLKLAQCELAYQLHNVDLFAQNEAADKGVKAVKAGSVEVEFQAVDVSSREGVDTALWKLGPEFDYTRLPIAVRMLLVPSWYTRSRVGGIEPVFEVS